MFRTFTVIFVICLISGLVGCRFCSSPYDYCSPTFTGNNYDYYRGDPCNPNYAAGSRFLGTEDVCSCNSCDACSSCGGSGCSSCDSENHEHAAEVIEQPMSVKKVTRSNAGPVSSPVKKIPTPPAPPAVAVPQTIKGVSALKQSQNVSQGLAVPKPVVPKANYAKSAVQPPSDPVLEDPANMLEELRELNPDAVDLKIIGFEEE